MQIKGKAILFDMDGTLVDSTLCVEHMWRQWGARHGVPLESILAISHGRMTCDTVRQIAPHLDADAEAVLMDREATGYGEGIVAIAGAQRLINQLKPDQWAVVTSAPHALALARLGFAGLPVPRVLIGNEDVRSGKPDPDGFLKGAAGLGFSPGACVAVEDTPAGITAARAAGMPVVAIGSTFPESALLGAPWVRDFRTVTFREADEGAIE